MAKKMTRGQRIKEIRGDMTQSEFADHIGIKQAMVSRYEADKELPSPPVLLKIAAYAGHSIEWILTGQEVVGTGVEKPGKKELERMSRADTLELAAEIVEQSGHPDAESFATLMRSALSERKTMLRLLDFFRFLQYGDREG